MLSGIWVEALAEFDHDLDALLGTDHQIILRIGFVGFLEAGKDSDLFLHAQIIRAWQQENRLRLLPNIAYVLPFASSMLSEEEEKRILEMRFPSVLATLTILAFQGHAPGFSAPQISDLVGDWSGTSLCQAKPSPCHDENVIFRFSKPHDDKITIQADKIVDGKAVTMGIGEWTYDKSAGTLTWQIRRGDWKLIVNGNTMDGTLIVPDNVVFRKIHLEKSK